MPGTAVAVPASERSGVGARRRRTKDSRIVLYVLLGAGAVFVAGFAALALNDELRIWRVRRAMNEVAKELEPSEAENELRAAAATVTRNRIAKHGCQGLEKPTIVSNDGVRWAVVGWSRREGEPIQVTAAWEIIYSGGKRRWDLARLEIGKELVYER